MNKEKLLELSDTLRGIAEGKEWEVRKWTWFAGLWDSPKCGDPLSALEQSYEIRLKPQPPQPDPYAELKAAHAAGKEIQIFCHGKWCDCDPEWLSDSEYRIKPEPQRLPLCADDVKAGDEFLAPDGYRRQWEKLSDKGISFVWAYASWDDLAVHGYKIRSLNETDWRPCYKLVEQ